MISGRLRTGAMCAAIVFGALGAGAAPAAAHYYTTRCDRDGDDCHRVLCDDDGDDCHRVYNNYYRQQYYRPRYYGYENSYPYNDSYGDRGYHRYHQHEGDEDDE
jgi:hypothetical protein